MVNFAPQPQANVCGHLVIAAAPSVQAFACVAHQLGQARFDIEVHVLKIQLPVELSRINFCLYLRQTAVDRGEVIGADDVLGLQHVGVGQ